MPDRYRAVDVPVRGGNLRVGIWEPSSGARDAPTVLAVHGITASHRAWVSVAERLPDARVVAPDLRGRGRSRDVPGPFGIGGHADDLAGVLDHLAVPAATVVGHSMGGFVTVATVHRHRDRVAGAVLVDGGLPLPVPEGLTPDEVTAAILGPAQQRLSMTFASREQYRDFFRRHPAFAEWTDAAADYVDYDLIGEPGAFHASTVVEAMAADSRSQQDGEDWLLPGLAALPPGTPFLRAPLGLLAQEPGLFPAPWVARRAGEYPALDVREVAGTNHYTLLFNDAGLAAVTRAVRDVLPAV
ncbi:MAG TPA: alpha/beta fold hydrolase [Nakamurella sp.]